jgi:hypothetical protein
VVLGWLAWVLGVALGSVVATHWLGAWGAALAVLGTGWLLARQLPVPGEWWRWYHLDDLELTAVGPGHVVRRLPWNAIERLTQERTTVRLEAPGMTIALPLDAVVRSEAWDAILARVVPGLAGSMWARLEDGEEVRLRPPVEPRPETLLWWAWLPGVVACATGASGPAVVALVAAERLLAWLRARRGTVALHRRCVDVRAGLRRLLVTWQRAEMVRAPHGLLVGEQDGGCGLVATSLPNFWAVVPVIETKVALAPGADATVHFRVRRADGRLAVVGEVEPMA